MDKLFIRQLKVSAALGILPRERTNRQDVLIDVEIPIDAQPAAIKDHISATVDYAVVRETISQFAQQHRFDLIETFANKLAALLMQKFKLMGLRLTLTKPTIFEDAKGVGITVERGCIDGQ